jgi:hypothetical protein
VRPAGVAQEIAVQLPSVQAVCEGQVAWLAPRQVILGGSRLTLQERPQQVVAVHLHGQPVHDRAGHPHRRARRGREGQAVGEAPHDLPGAAGSTELNPRRGDLGA